MGNNDWSIKEAVSGILSLTIVGSTIWLMSAIFGEATNVTVEAYQHHSAILQAAMGFAGTVIGYYFGRVPAERGVLAAQRNATDAQQLLATSTTQAAANAAQADQANDAKRRAASQILALKEQFFPDSPLGGGTSTAPSRHVDDRLLHQLDQILRELS